MQEERWSNAGNPINSVVFGKPRTRNNLINKNNLISTRSRGSVQQLINVFDDRRERAVSQNCNMSKRSKDMDLLEGGCNDEIEFTPPRKRKNHSTGNNTSSRSGVIEGGSNESSLLENAPGLRPQISLKTLNTFKYEDPQIISM